MMMMMISAREAQYLWKHEGGREGGREVVIDQSPRATGENPKREITRETRDLH